MSNIITLSAGPSGGKTRVANYILDKWGLEQVPLYTTRPERPDESSDRKIVAEPFFWHNDFILSYRWEANNHLYGVLQADFERAQRLPRPSLLTIDLNPWDLYEALDQPHMIYLDVPSSTLHRRLMRNHSIPEEERIQRFMKGKEYREQFRRFPHVYRIVGEAFEEQRDLADQALKEIFRRRFPLELAPSGAPDIYAVEIPPESAEAVASPIDEVRTLEDLLSFAQQEEARRKDRVKARSEDIAKEMAAVLRSRGIVQEAYEPEPRRGRDVETRLEAANDYKPPRTERRRTAALIGPASDTAESAEEMRRRLAARDAHGRGSRN